MTTMLALRAHRDSTVLHLEEIPVPEPGPLDVVVKVASAGLAPGMVRLLEMGAFKHLPTTLGHEAAGTITAVGSAVPDFGVSDRVRVHPNLNCGRCDYCRSDRDMMCRQQAMLGHAAFGDIALPLYDEYHNGGIAEYVRIPHWPTGCRSPSASTSPPRCTTSPTPCARSNALISDREPRW